jgi:hypothetical protein
MTVRNSSLNDSESRLTTACRELSLGTVLAIGTQYGPVVVVANTPGIRLREDHGCPGILPRSIRDRLMRAFIQHMVDPCTPKLTFHLESEGSA